MLDKGPAPTDKEEGMCKEVAKHTPAAVLVAHMARPRDIAAAAFRAFWGDKAELRRFKDGSILEAVVWDQPPGYVNGMEPRCRTVLPADTQCTQWQRDGDGYRTSGDVPT